MQVLISGGYFRAESRKQIVHIVEGILIRRLRPGNNHQGAPLPAGRLAFGVYPASRPAVFCCDHADRKFSDDPYILRYGKRPPPRDDIL